MGDHNCEEDRRRRALFVAAALALSGCSAQLSQADTCTQLKSIMEVSKSVPSGASDSQKLDAAKAVIGQMKDLSGKASDDLRGDLGTMTSTLDQVYQAMQSKDAAALTSATSTASNDQYKTAVSHISSACKISS